MRKPFRTAAEIAVAALTLSFIILAEAAVRKTEQTAGERHLCGAYTGQRPLEAEDFAVFLATVRDTAIMPVSVATQVVAGINYRFLCRKDGHDTVIVIWRDPKGVLRIIDSN